MIPYKCPICDGHGIVPGGFYSSTGGRSISTNSTEPCRACGGTGIVWGDGPSPVYGGEFRYEEDEETGQGSAWFDVYLEPVDRTEGRDKP